MSVRAVLELCAADPEAAEKFKAVTTRAEGEALLAEYGIEPIPEDEAQAQMAALMADVQGGMKVWETYVVVLGGAVGTIGATAAISGSVVFV